MVHFHIKSVSLCSVNKMMNFNVLRCWIEWKWQRWQFWSALMSFSLGNFLFYNEMDRISVPTCQIWIKLKLIIRLSWKLPIDAKPRRGTCKTHCARVQGRISNALVQIQYHFAFRVSPLHFHNLGSFIRFVFYLCCANKGKVHFLN